MRTPDTVLWRAARSPIHSWIQRAVTASRWPELSRFSPASAGWAQCLGYSALCPGLWGWVSRHQRWNAEEVLNTYYIEMSKKKGVSATDCTRTSTGLEPEADGPGPRALLLSYRELPRVPLPSSGQAGARKQNKVYGEPPGACETV